MDPEFWQTRWQENKIGFHQEEVNKLLMKYWPVVRKELSRPSDVFVPLCGKSHDMIWLAAQPEHSGVIGVELSPLAIRQFFQTEFGSVPAPHRQGAHDVYRHQDCELWCGDFFAFPKDRLENARLAYDRAALIALPADMRKDYAARLSAMLPRDARMLLLTISYDESEMDGPPFSVSDDEVHRLFGSSRYVERLETRDGLTGAKNLQDRGLTALTTSVFLIAEAKTA